MTKPKWKCIKGESNFLSSMAWFPVIKVRKGINKKLAVGVGGEYAEYDTKNKCAKKVKRLNRNPIANPSVLRRLK